MKVSETEPQIPKSISQNPKEKKQKKNCGEKEKSVKEKYIEMKEQIKLYNRDLTDSIMTGKKSVNENFKTHFFKALTNLVQQLDLCKDDSSKQKKVNEVYKWYNNRTKFFNDLNPIDKFTAKRYFETIPDISKHKKIEIYEARNFPVEYESANRTEIGGLVPPKDRKITPVNPNTSKAKQDKEMNWLDEDNSKTKTGLTGERVLSANSSVAASTHYSTNLSTTGNKFFNQTASSRFNQTGTFRANNQVKAFDIPIDYKREIKTSHGYHRPAYETNNIEMNKNWIVEKHRELADKKHSEQVKEFVNEWAFNKSKHVEEIERKQELKLLLKNYEKINYKPQGKHADDENNENFDEDPEENNIEKLEKEFPQEDTNIIVDARNMTAQPKDNQTKKIVDLKKGNIGPDNKAGATNSLKNRFEKNFPLEVIPALRTDKLTTTRKLYGNMIEVPEIDNLKPGEYHTSYKHALSLYDNYNEMKEKMFNEEKPNISIKHKVFSGERPNTVHEMVNPLRQRRTLSAFNNLNEVKDLKNDLNKVNVAIPLKSLKDAFVSPDAGRYPKYYLPNPAFGLMTNPVPDKPKGKKIKSAK